MADARGTIITSLLHPLSRGTVRPRSANHTGSRPMIDLNFLADPTDGILLAGGTAFGAALMSTTAMRQLASSPGPALAALVGSGSNRGENNSGWALYVRRAAASGFHPAGTTAMLPLARGGVVDTRLRVYGTANLHNNNAGVMPLVPGAHLQAGVYATAEKVSLPPSP